MPSKFLNLSTDTTLGGNAPSDELAVSQKAIKTYVDNHSGGGSVAIDNSTITKNTSDEIQAVAVIDQNTGIIKPWSGTGAEYEDISEIDPDTLYITDDIGLPATEIGEITEDINDLKEHTVIEFQEPTAANNYTWYRKYADGWVEQGGNYDAGSYSPNIYANITYPIEMANTRYTKLFGKEKDSDGGWEGYLNYTNPTTTGATVRYWNNGSATIRYISWQVSGMAA